MISFGGGYPNPSTFPFESMDLSFRGGEKIHMPQPALQYGPSPGHPALVQELIRWHKSKDELDLSAENMVVLNGAQEGLFIAGYLFLDPHDSVVCSEPTYPGAISSFSTFTDRFISIPLDEEGMDTDLLGSELKRMADQGIPLPKFIYTVPNGHNPGGVALSQKRREAMIRLAVEYDLCVLEDDPYQLLQLKDGSSRKTIQSMDTDGRVIRLDSFSKIFAPGLRIGYASGSEEMMRHFTLFKQAANLHTSSLSQQILAEYLEKTGPAPFKAAIQEKCLLYRENRDAMVEAATRLLPAEVEFTVPEEGFFIWFRLPPYCDAEFMVEQYSRELKVVLVPGPAFSPHGACGNCMRASFSMVDREGIETGMTSFAEMIQREKSRNS
jgi:DNA-binding transcriptional MocR family regulator